MSTTFGPMAKTIRREQAQCLSADAQVAVLGRGPIALLQQLGALQGLWAPRGTAAIADENAKQCAEGVAHGVVDRMLHEPIF